MDNEEKEDALQAIDRVIDALNDLLSEYEFSNTADALIQQARELLNKAQSKL